ncbi:MAG: hypothetical protein ACI9R3_002949 [Verrucomicrobiales bacterium]
MNEALSVNFSGGIITFLVFFPCSWIFVQWILSHIGGWKRLATHYRDETAVQYSHFGQSGRVGWVYYGLLKIGASDAGLHLAAVPVFNFFHPPLTIPWATIGDVRYYKFFFSSRVRFGVNTSPATRLDLAEKLLRPMLESHGVAK